MNNYSFQFNHWNAKNSLSDWLKNEKVPAITDIDTRALTKKLREKGTMLGKIVYDKENISFEDPNKRNLVAEVSIKNPTIHISKISIMTPLE